MIIQNKISKLEIQRFVYLNKLIRNNKIKVTNEELYDPKKRKALLKGHNLNSHYTECNRKSLKLEERLGVASFWEDNNKTNSKIMFTPDEAAIYFVLLNGAIMHNSLVSVWCNEGLVNFTAEEKVRLYEDIRENIYRCRRIGQPGENSFIDQWLQVVDVQLNYTISIRKIRIRAILEKIRTIGMLNNSLEVEKSFEDIQNLMIKYIEQATNMSKDMLEWAIDYAKCCDLLSDDLEDSEEIEEIEEEIDIEYEQRNNALRNYVKSEAKGVEDVLDKKNMTKDEVLRLLDYL